MGCDWPRRAVGANRSEDDLAHLGRARSDEPTAHGPALSAPVGGTNRELWPLQFWGFPSVRLVGCLVIVATTIITAGVGALVAFVFAVLNQLLSESRAFRRRWDREVFSLVSDLIGATRTLMHLSSPNTALNNAESELRSALLDVRLATGRVLLIADPSLSEAAVNLQSAAYRLSRTRLDSEQSETLAEQYDVTYEQVAALIGSTRAQLKLAAVERIRRG